MQYSDIQEVACPLIPELKIIRTKDGKCLVTAVSAIMHPCEQEQHTAEKSWSRFQKTHPCMIPTTNTINASGPDEFAYVYITKNGRQTAALSISPGLEYLCQNKGGVKADANKEKFLELIHDFQQPRSSTPGSKLGKRPYTAQDDELNDTTSVCTSQRKILEFRFKRNAALITAHVDGAMQTIKTDMKTIGDGVGEKQDDIKREVQKVNDQFTGVGVMQTKIENEVKRVGNEVKKSNQASIQNVEFYQQQLLKAEEANERQRYTISELNKQLKKQQSSQGSATADGKMIMASLDSLKKENAAMRMTMESLKKDNAAMKAAQAANDIVMQSMHSMLTTMMGVIAP